jgi:hypothetical protein
MKQELHVANERTARSAARVLHRNGAHLKGLVVAPAGSFRTGFAITTDPWPEESPL